MADRLAEAEELMAAYSHFNACLSPFASTAQATMPERWPMKEINDANTRLNNAIDVVLAAAKKEFDDLSER